MSAGHTSTRAVVGYFQDEHSLIEAVKEVRQRGLPIEDAYTPYAVHGLDKAMGLKPSRLTWVCFFAAGLGLLSAAALQYYTSVTSWPLNVGGKPHNSVPAFIPVAFELTILFAGLITVGALFFRARLFPGRKAEVLPRVTDDRFALAVSTRVDGADPETVSSMLMELGAETTDRVEVAS